MIDLSEITTKLETLISQKIPEAVIARSDWLNEDPNQCPWISVYKSDVSYNPRSLGQGPSRWMATVVCEVAIQEYSVESGADCEDLLEGKVKSVLDLLSSNYSLDNLVDTITNINVTYSMREDVEEDMYFQMALLRITWDVETSHD